MTYGFSYENMSRVAKPVRVAFPWGYHELIVSNEMYGVEKYFISKSGTVPLRFHLKREGSILLESGEVELRYVGKNGKFYSVKMTGGEIFDIAPGQVYGFRADADSVLYFFSNSSQQDDNYVVGDFYGKAETPGKSLRKTFDFRDKYWGSIETVVSKDYCGKRIYMKKDCQNSLEVHCNKHETYYVHSGSVSVGIRVGRGENKWVDLKSGDCYSIPPGLIHMKLCREDCIIMEISTKDDDSDSHIVEDGKNYVHKVV